MTSMQAPMQPRPIRHWGNLIWWLVLVCLVIAGHELPKLLADKFTPPAPTLQKQNNLENEAFIALVFGKVSTAHELAISASTFEAQLTALKQAGYSSVRLEQVKHWQQTTTAPLPIKPVLLTFEEANRETMEIADNILTTLGMTAVVFVDVNQLNLGNINLVSWHKLELMAKSGRWEVGVSGCPNGDNAVLNTPELLAQDLAKQRELLEHRLQIPVLSADCSRTWSTNAGNAAAVWAQALDAAALQIGFVAAPFGANYRTDPESNLRRIRVSRAWDQAALLSQLDNHAPRRAPFTDNFQSDPSVAAWVVDSGEIALENDNLKLFNIDGEKGALMTLSGTDKWQDAEIEVQLKDLPKGQFWMSLRHTINQPSVRLGIAEGLVMLQAPDATGVYRQLASHAVAAGEITLKLRIVGIRAIAYLNGQALLTRPVAIPEGADHGSFALAVWNKDADVVTIGRGDASAQLVKVTATPLFLKGGIMAPSPSEVVWNQLRQHSEQLSMVSPHYFTWLDGTAQVSTADRMTLEIFAHFHHLKFLPALFIDENTPLSDSAALTEQALAWAMAPAYDGLNIVLKNSPDQNRWQPLLSDLYQRMSQAGKTLMVTQLDNQAQLGATSDNHLLIIAADSDLLSTGPKVLHPLSTEPAP